MARAVEVLTAHRLTDWGRCTAGCAWGDPDHTSPGREARHAEHVARVLWQKLTTAPTDAQPGETGQEGR